MSTRHTRRASRAVTWIVVGTTLEAACGSHKLPLPADIISPPGAESTTTRVEMASDEAMAAFEGPPEGPYRIGRGDRVQIDVWGRAELSGPQTVGPDGQVTLPVAGSLSIDELTRDEAAAAVRATYARYYLDPVVTVRVDDYAANRIFVLGRVAVAGALRFDASITLLEALARAGSLPVGGTGAEMAALNRCAVFRGRDRALWVNLQNLLSGQDPLANVRLRRNDIVYLPDSEDQLVLVLGEVARPGAYRITPEMRILDALGKAGGATRDGASGAIRFLRPSRKVQAKLSWEDLASRRSELNVRLQEGDIIYVPPRTLAKIGYVLEKVSAGLVAVILSQINWSGSKDTTTPSSSNDPSQAPPRLLP